MRFIYPYMPAIRQKTVIAIVVAAVIIMVVVTVLKVAASATVIILGIVGLGFVLLLALKIRNRRRTSTIFRFYVAAEDALRSSDRRRYRFEMADIIKAGEKVVRMMSDPPPLSRFALGALYNSIGDHNGTVEQLGFAAEEEVLKESSLVSPSRQLRRYVKRLRQIERSPKRSAKINAAIAALESMQRQQAAGLLAESQQQLKRMVEAYESDVSRQLPPPRSVRSFFPTRSLDSITAPPPISDVLRDIYPEEQKAP